MEPLTVLKAEEALPVIAMSGIGCIKMFYKNIIKRFKTDKKRFKNKSLVFCGTVSFHILHARST